MANHRRASPAGQGRISMALGANDPRARRNAAASLQTEVTLDRTIEIDNRGRMGVKGARPVAKIQEGATMEELILKMNELIQSQTDSGQMRGGR